jgi:hypothetical protein
MDKGTQFTSQQDPMGDFVGYLRQRIVIPYKYKLLL